MRAAALAAALVLAACGSKKARTDEAPAAGTGATASTTGDAAAGPAEADDPSGWIADLDAIATELPKRHPSPYTRRTAEAFTLDVADLRAKLPMLTTDQRITGLARIVALLGDAHTQLHPGKLARAAIYPVTFYWFTDGIFVTDAAEPHRWAIGARVVAVGDTPIDVVAGVLATTVGWEADGWRRAEVAWRLAWPLFMRGSDLAPREGAARFVVEQGGQQRDLLLEPAVWRPKAPDPSTVPLYRRKPNAFYWSQALPDQRALYVQYNKCANAPDLSFADFVRALEPGLDGVERVVIDLRLNGGGDSRVMQPLLAALAARPALEGHVVALISRHTFSSGLMNAIHLDGIGAVLVGEPAGSPASHFGEVKYLDLPAHGLTVQYSTRRFDYPSYEGTALAPDVFVEVSSADYVAGKDPVLDRALSLSLPQP